MIIRKELYLLLLHKMENGKVLEAAWFNQVPENQLISMKKTNKKTLLRNQ